MDIFSQCSSNFLQKKWTTLQIRYSILSIKNRCIVEEDIQTHTRTLPPWAVVGGQHGAKDMHILKVIDWKELTCRHSEEFGMQAWHAHPHICWDRKGAAWEKSYAHCGGKCREMQLLTSCSHTGFMYSKWSNRHGQILWNIYMKSCSLCADLCWHVAVRLHEHTQGKSLVWVSEGWEVWWHCDAWENLRKDSGGRRERKKDTPPSPWLAVAYRNISFCLFSSSELSVWVAPADEMEGKEEKSLAVCPQQKHCSSNNLTLINSHFKPALACFHFIFYLMALGLHVNFRISYSVSGAMHVMGRIGFHVLWDSFGGLVSGPHHDNVIWMV